jgi:hypothetical protein
MTTSNTPPKNPQAASQPSITAAVAWVSDTRTKQCVEYAASDDRRVDHPAPPGVRICEQADLPELELHRHTRVAIRDPDSDPPSRLAHSEPFQGATVQRPGRDHRPRAGWWRHEATPTAIDDSHPNGADWRAHRAELANLHEWVPQRRRTWPHRTEASVAAPFRCGRDC